jgi:hypothetical protein
MTEICCSFDNDLACDHEGNVVIRSTCRKFLRKRSDDIPPKCLNELPQFLQGRTVLFGGRLLQLYIYKDSGRPDFGFGRIDHLESISKG